MHLEQENYHPENYNEILRRFKHDQAANTRIDYYWRYIKILELLVNGSDPKEFPNSVFFDFDPTQWRPEDYQDILNDLGNWDAGCMLEENLK